jgi:hypothetical protein
MWCWMIPRYGHRGDELKSLPGIEHQSLILRSIATYTGPLLSGWLANYSETFSTVPYKWAFTWQVGTNLTRGSSDSSAGNSFLHEPRKNSFVKTRVTAYTRRSKAIYKLSLLLWNALRIQKR